VYKRQVLTWLGQTDWEQENLLPEKEIDQVSECLLRAGVLEVTRPAENLIA
jgi:hypothetical protein